jgi:hypothetical protein
MILSYLIKMEIIIFLHFEIYLTTFIGLNLVGTMHTCDVKLQW